MAYRRRKRDDRSRRLGRWLAASLLALVGTGVLGLLFVALFNRAPGKRTSPDPIALRSVSRSMWDQNRKLGPQPDPKAPAAQQARSEPVARSPEEELRKKEPDPIPDGKIVDVAPGNGKVPDEDAKFLAETNNRVEKETRSKDATPFYKNAMPRPSSPLKPSDGKGHDVVDEAVLAGNGGKGDEETPAKDGSKRSIFEIPSVKKTDELALRFDGLNGMLKNQPGSEEIKGNSDRLKVQVGGEGGEESEASSGRAGDSELRTLTPSATVLDRIAGAPASDLTPLDEVELGNGTYLNTREWKYSSFFNRIKQYVGMHWDPNTVVRTKDPTGEIFLYKDRYTVVAVTLDDQGLLKSISVDKSCGVEFLDAEAMQAFRRAQPFPNPPPGLQNDHGEIRFTFGFYLEVNKGGLQLFRPAR